MWLRFAAHGSVAYLGGVDQAYYRKHAASMHITTFNSFLADLTQRKSAFDAVFDNHGEAIRNAGELRLAAHLALCREALSTACWCYDSRRLGQVSVDDLEVFARDTYPGLRSLTQYWGLRWRRRLGPRWPPFLRPILPGVYLRWVKNRLWWRRWRIRGI
jgi:hypothetical protein